MKKLLLFLFVAAFIACSSYKPLAPSQADAQRAAQKFPGTTLADLEQGKSIFEEKCHKCHSLKKPFRKDDETIAKALPRMAHRAKIDSSQENLVLKYLLTMNPVAKQN